MIVPVILSGGSGTRLWPLSRQNLPKQFLALAGPDTLFQQTVKRAAGVPGATAPLVVASDDHRFLAGEQLQAIGVTPRAIVLEPLARNTAPAIALAALQVAERDPAALLLVLPAITALLVVNIAFGVMTRAAPQLNIFAIGFPLTLVLGMVILWIGLADILNQYQPLASEALQFLRELAQAR